MKASWKLKWYSGSGPRNDSGSGSGRPPMSSQLFSVSASASKCIFLSDSDCTFSAERRKLVALSENMNLPQLSIYVWRADFLFDGSVCSTLRLGNNPLCQRAVYSSRNRWKLWVDLSLTSLSSALSQLKRHFVRMSAAAGLPFPSIHPQLWLFCTAIKDKRNQIHMQWQNTSHKQRGEKKWQTWVGKIKIISLGFIEAEQSKNEIETELKRCTV